MAQALDTNKKKMLRLTADDTTPEALTSLLHQNGGCISIISAEGGIFTILAGLYNSKGTSNIANVLKAHAGDRIRVDRKGRDPEHVENPRLTMIIFLQDEVINSLFANDQFRGRGLCARMLFCKPTSKVGRRSYDTQPIPTDVEQRYNEAIFSLLGHEGPDILMLSPEADAVARDWFHFLEPLHTEELACMGDWSGKLHGATLRIAGLLHCMKHWNTLAGNLIVDEDTMKNAVKIGKYFLEHAKWAYSTMGADGRAEQAQYILKKLLEHGGTELARRDILRLCRKFKTVAELAPSLELLEERGYVRRFEPLYNGTGRKPDVIYKINPTVTGVTDVTEQDSFLSV